MAIYFGSSMTSTTIGVLLNWGPIIGIVFFPIQTWILQQKNGLRRGIWFGMILSLLGNIIRCVPILIKETGLNKSFTQSTTAYVFYHVGQIFIAAAGPLFMGSVTKLSVIWFAEDERNLSTAIATTANGLGTTIGFLNPQWLSIPGIFLLSFILSSICVICGLFYLPSGPKTPPSAAALVTFVRKKREENDVEARATPLLSLPSSSLSSSSSSSWFETIKVAGTNRSFVLLVVAAAVLSGVQSGWQGLLQLILAPTGISQNQVAWIGFGNAFAGNIAAVSAGFLMDRCFKHRLKFGIVFGLIGCLLTTLWFAVQLPCFIWGEGLIPRTEFTLVLSLTLSGFFFGSTTPLFYELSAELIYPVKEGMSAGILVLLLNISAAIIIVVQNYLNEGLMNLIVNGIILVVLGLVVCCVKELYTRPQNV